MLVGYQTVNGDAAIPLLKEERAYENRENMHISYQPIVDIFY